MVVLAYMLWVQVRPYENTEAASVSWKKGGTPWIVAVTVYDSDGSLLTGVNVDVDNLSGGEGSYTVSGGTAVVGPMGEPEFLGLIVNGVRVVDRPFAYELGAPNVSKGLIVEVRLRD